MFLVFHVLVFLADRTDNSYHQIIAIAF